jgi:hypothetical protein
VLSFDDMAKIAGYNNILTGGSHPEPVDGRNLFESKK